MCLRDYRYSFHLRRYILKEYGCIRKLNVLNRTGIDYRSSCWCFLSLTISGIPQDAVMAIQELNMQPRMVLLVINIFLLFVGCVLDPGSAILVLTPLLAPIAMAMGVDLIHFGIIMTVNLAIGMFTPPFGLNIFITQALFKAPLSSIYPGLVPFIIVNLVALVVITYVPELSLYLLQFVN